jgi:hypothetical protein
MTANVLLVLSLALPLAAPQQRDANARAAGAAAITGVVMTSDAAPQPVRRAVVSVSGPVLRSAICDDHGRFSIASLPAGSYMVTAAKAAYVTTAYGAARAGGAGTAIALAETQTIDITLPLPRGAVIAGTIRDPRGAPITGASVAAINLETALPGSSIGPPVTLTDDHGGFRIYGLPPGDYVVAASAKIQGTGAVTMPTEEEVDGMLAELARRREGGAATPGAPRRDPPLPTPQTAGIVPSFFPGTVLFSQATSIVLGAGDERDGVDFAVGVVPAGTIFGSISGDPAAVETAIVSIVPDGPFISTLPGSLPVMVKHAETPGKFEYTGVPPGRYRLTARAGGRPSAPGGPAGVGVGGSGSGAPRPAAPGDPVPYVYATIDVDVRGGDQPAALLALSPGRTFAGRLVFDGAPAPADAASIAVQLTTGGGTWSRQNGPTLMGNSLGSVPQTNLKEDGTFVIAGVPPARFNVRAHLPATISAAWWVRSVMAGGRDLLDQPPDFSTGIDIKDAVVTISNRHTSLGGRLLTAEDQPAPGYFVVVFPKDPELWLRNGRRLKVTRPTSAGEFAFQDLPPGDYLLAALSDADGSAWQRPEFLEQVVPAAVAVTIGEGEKTRKDLRVGAKTVPSKTTSGVVFGKTTPDVVF